MEVKYIYIHDFTAYLYIYISYIIYDINNMICRFTMTFKLWNNIEFILSIYVYII